MDSGPGEPKPILLPLHGAEPTYPDASLEPPDLAPPAQATRPIWRRPLWLVTAIVAVALVAGLLGLLALLGSGGSAAGQRTAQLAAQRFVAAIDSGDPSAAKAASCPAFADQARAAAETGADPGISFTLGSVGVTGSATATAQITERLKFSGSSQKIALVLELVRSQGRWLVCGRR